MKEKLKNSIRTLFGYCRAKNKWDVDVEDPPCEKVLEIAFKYYNDVWSLQQYLYFLNEALAVEKTKTLTDDDIYGIIDRIFHKLEANKGDVFIIIPLKGATLKSPFSINNFHFINANGGMFSKPNAVDDIVQEVVVTTGMDEAKVKRDISAFVHGRASDLPSTPMLIIKEVGQYDEIGTLEYCSFVLKYINLFINTLAAHNKIKRSPFSTEWVKANHFFCTDGNRNYNHYPLREMIYVNYEVDFLRDPNTQKIFSDFNNIFRDKQNTLQELFLRSMKFYNRGLIGSEFSIDDISYKLLNTLISAETLLVFSTRGEMKSKLAHALIGLNSVAEIDRKKYFDAIIEAYKDRSWLMHSGKQELHKYIKEIGASEQESESLQLLSEMMAKVLASFPNWYLEISNSTSYENYLSEWEKKVKSYLPTLEYNLLQKALLYVIRFIRWIGRLKDDIG